MRISDWSSDVCSSDLTAFEQADQVLARVALHARRFDIVLLELLFGDVAVIALQLLLGAKLDAIVGHLALAALAVLAGAVFAAVDRALRTAPDVFAHPAVEFILGALALRHISLQSAVCRRISACPGSHRREYSMRDRRFTGVRGPLRRRAVRREGRASQAAAPFGGDVV